MKIKCSFEFVDMGDEYIAVPVGEGAAPISGVLRLNNTGKEIVELLCNETTIESIISSLSEKYDDDRIIISNYVSVIINTLRKNNLLDE